MRFLRTNTAIRLTVGPFLDKTDGVTPETALTVTSCKLTLMVDDANVPTLVLDVAPTASGGSNDMVHVTGDDAGFYDLELAAANVNYLGRAMLAITDAATHCPVFHEFMILPAMVYDAMVLGTDVLQADVTQFLGTAVSTPATAGILDVNIKNIDNDAASASGTVTFPNATLASTTNITAGTITTVTNLTNAPTAGDLTATMKTSVETATQTGLTAQGYTSTRAGYLDTLNGLVAAIWAAATSGLTTVGSIGKKLADWTIGTAQTGDAFARLGAPAGASVSADIAAMKVDTAAILVDTGTTLDARIPAALVGGRMDASVGAMAANVMTAAALATDAGAEIADAVWDEVLSGHLTAGTTGAGLNAAGSAGDPWSTAVPGAYGAGTAGKILGDNLNATVSSRASQTSVDTVDDFLDTEIAAIKAKTDNLPAAPAAVSDIPTAAGVADAVWDEARAGHVGAGSFGEGVILTSAYDAAKTAATQASVNTIDDFLDTEVAGILAAVDTEVGAIKTTTDQLTFTTANKVDARAFTVDDKTGYSIASGGIGSGAHAAAELNALADAFLDRNMATGTDSGANNTTTRTVRQALRRLRNKESIAAGTLSIFKEDDVTSSWTAAVTTTAGDPLSAVDPV